MEKINIEYTFKQVSCIQNNRTECLKVHDCRLIVEGSVGQFFKICWNIFPALR